MPRSLLPDLAISRVSLLLLAPAFRYKSTLQGAVLTSDGTILLRAAISIKYYFVLCAPPDMPGLCAERLVRMIKKSRYEILCRCPFINTISQFSDVVCD